MEKSTKWILIVVASFFVGWILSLLLHTFCEHDWGSVMTYVFSAALFGAIGFFMHQQLEAKMVSSLPPSLQPASQPGAGAAPELTAAYNY